MLWLATLGPVGRLPASGTMASLVAMLMFFPIAYYFPFQTQALIVAGVTGCGVLICSVAAKRLKQKDPSMVVWDELVGMWIALLAAPGHPLYWAVAFLLFRLFDISKLGPVGWCDKRIKGGLGIVADDVIAGGLALVGVQCVWWVRLW